MASSSTSSSSGAAASAASSQSSATLVSGLWLGAASPAPELAQEVPVNPISWSLTLLPPKGGAAPTAFGGGYFDDAGDIPDSPVLLFTISGSFNPETNVRTRPCPARSAAGPYCLNACALCSQAVKLTKRYQNHHIPESLTVDYEGVLGKEADGAFSIKGSWVNALEGTMGQFACRLEGSEDVTRGCSTVVE